MKLSRYITFISIGLMAAFTGCQDDDINVRTDVPDDGGSVEVGLPAVNFKYKLADFIKEVEEEVLRVDKDGLIYLLYSKKSDIEWDSLVVLNDTSIEKSFSMADAFTSPALKATSYSHDFVEKIKLNHRDDARYDSMTLQQGFLNLELQVPDGMQGTVTVTFPEITFDGVAATETFFPDGSSNQVFQYSLPLEGSDIEFSQDSDQEPYFSYISLEVGMDIDSFDPLQPQEGFIDFSLSGMKSLYGFGYFGQQRSDSKSESMSIDVFEELELLNEFLFKELEVHALGYSKMGVPFDVLIENIQFFDRHDNQVGELVHQGDPFIETSLSPATYDTSPMDGINATSDSVIIDEGNSNIANIGNRYPVRMEFDVSSLTNPGGNQGQVNFVGPNDQLQGEIRIKIPAHLKTEYVYQRHDSVDFDIIDIVGDDQEDVRGIDTLEIFLDFFNKIPLNVMASAWVIDGEGNKIDDLLGEAYEVMGAGKPNGENGRVEEAVHTLVEIKLGAHKIDKFLQKEAKEIVVQSELTTYENSYIKLYDYMQMRVDFSFSGGGQLPDFD